MMYIMLIQFDGCDDMDTFFKGNKSKIEDFYAQEAYARATASVKAENLPAILGELDTVFGINDVKLNTQTI